MNPNQQLVNNLDTEISILSLKAAEFAEEFLKNPFHALEDSEGMFQRAATLAVYKRLRNALVSKQGELYIDVTIGSLRIYAQKQITEGVLCSSPFAPPTQKLAEQYTMLAWAKALDPLDGILFSVEGT